MEGLTVFIFCFQLLQTKLQTLEQKGDGKGKAVIAPTSKSAPSAKLETNSHID
jgi:hypothetical protein